MDAIIRSGLSRFTDEVGRLWCKLADYYIRLGQFERARDVYEEAINSVVREIPTEREREREGSGRRMVSRACMRVVCALYAPWYACWYGYACACACERVLVCRQVMCACTMIVAVSGFC